MPSPLGEVSPKVTEEVRAFAKQKCIAEGDLYGNTQGIRPLPTSLRSATFPRGEGMTTPQILIYPAGLIFLDEYRQVSYNDSSRIDFSAATEP
jgi:hypothetical protein